MNLIAKPFSPELLPFWKEVYNDPTTKTQMYLPPLGNDLDFIKSIQSGPGNYAFTVFQDDEPIGTIRFWKSDPETTTIASFGLAIHPKHRGKGLAKKFMALIEKTAKSLGFLTLRADVYADNNIVLKVLRQNGFRDFVWLEKNLISKE